MGAINRLPVMSGKKSLVLPDNTDSIIIQNSLGAFTIHWDEPTESELLIDHYNIYLSKRDERPTSIKDFHLIDSVSSDTFQYEITNLECDVIYYVVVESVSEDGYENAGIKHTRSARTINGYWLIGRPYNYNTKAVGRLCYSDDGVTWNNLVSSYSFGISCLIAVEGVIYYLSSRDGYYGYIDIENKEIKTIYTLSAYDGYCLSFTGNRIIFGLNSGSSMYFYYATKNPDTGMYSNVVNKGKQAYAWTAIGKNREVILPVTTTYWQYIADIAASASTITVKYCGYSNDSTTYKALSSAYGLGRYVIVGRKNLSTYILEENISNGSYVAMQSIEGGSEWHNVIFAEKVCKFFAVLYWGSAYYVFYSKDGETWVQMNGVFGWDGDLIYGNGRLIYTGCGGVSYYCVDGMNFIAMSGIVDNSNIVYCGASLYE